MGRKTEDGKRKTGKDKQKKTYEKYGKYTQKHIRQMEISIQERARTIIEKHTKKIMIRW